MGAKVVAHPGDPVDAVRNEENTADIQSVLPLIDKSAFSLITLGSIAVPSFSGPPYNLDMLTKFPILNASTLHIWGTSAATPGVLEFYVVLYDASGTQMHVLPFSPGTLNTFGAQDTAGLYHSSGLIDMWVATAAQVALWVVTVSGGPWTVYMRPY